MAKNAFFEFIKDYFISEDVSLAQALKIAKDYLANHSFKFEGEEIKFDLEELTSKSWTKNNIWNILFYYKQGHHYEAFFNIDKKNGKIISVCAP